ncbi:MAG: VRR-NUC domain-containing protein [Oscillospiraceae bacterium]|nr:VRR-NUC domain-containing protein [Oscillospiraceae bacterium]
MQEKAIEHRLLQSVKKIGGQCWKFVSPGNVGVPDRIVLLPAGRMAFVEVKASGKKPRPSQLAVHRVLIGLGFKVFVLDDVDQIEVVLNEIQST